MSAPTAIAGSDRFCGLESSDVQRDHITFLGFEHLDRPSAMRAVLFFRAEVDHRWLSKQKRRRQFASEAAELI
jgi:hypothetical protein